MKAWIKFIPQVKRRVVKLLHLNFMSKGTLFAISLVLLMFIAYFGFQIFHIQLNPWKEAVEKKSLFSISDEKQSRSARYLLKSATQNFQQGYYDRTLKQLESYHNISSLTEEQKYASRLLEAYSYLLYGEKTDKPKMILKSRQLFLNLLDKQEKLDYNLFLRVIVGLSKSSRLVDNYPSNLELYLTRIRWAGSAPMQQNIALELGYFFAYKKEWAKSIKSFQQSKMKIEKLNYLTPLFQDAGLIEYFLQFLDYGLFHQKHQKTMQIQAQRLALQQVQFLLNNKRDSEAQKILTHILVLFPNQMIEDESFYLLGRIYERNYKPKNALFSYTKGITNEVHFRDEDILYRLGYFFYRQGRYLESLDMFKRVVRFSSDKKKVTDARKLIQKIHENLNHRNAPSFYTTGTQQIYKPNQYLNEETKTPGIDRIVSEFYGKKAPTSSLLKGDVADLRKRTFAQNLFQGDHQKKEQLAMEAGLEKEESPLAMYAEASPKKDPWAKKSLDAEVKNPPVDPSIQGELSFEEWRRGDLQNTQKASQEAILRDARNFVAGLSDKEKEVWSSLSPQEQAMFLASLKEKDAFGAGLPPSNSGVSGNIQQNNRGLIGGSINQGESYGGGIAASNDSDLTGKIGQFKNSLQGGIQKDSNDVIGKTVGGDNVPANVAKNRNQQELNANVQRPSGEQAGKVTPKSEEFQAKMVENPQSVVVPNGNSSERKGDGSFLEDLLMLDQYSNQQNSGDLLQPRIQSPNQMGLGGNEPDVSTTVSTGDVDSYGETEQEDILGLETDFIDVDNGLAGSDMLPSEGNSPRSQQQQDNMSANQQQQDNMSAPNNPTPPTVADEVVENNGSTDEGLDLMVAE